MTNIVAGLPKPLRLTILALTVPAIIQSGCKDDNPPPETTALPESQKKNTVPQDATPLETINILRAARSEGHYDQLANHLQPEREADVVSLLRATDRLIAASSMLTARVKQVYGPAAVDKFQYDNLNNIAGVFSRDVTFISEDIEGNTATVVYQIADRLPLDSVKLVHRDHRWILKTEPIGDLPDAIFNLADLFERMAKRLVERNLTPDQLQKEIEIRSIPIFRQIESMTPKP